MSKLVSFFLLSMLLSAGCRPSEEPVQTEVRKTLTPRFPALKVRFSAANRAELLAADDSVRYLVRYTLPGEGAQGYRGEIPVLIVTDPKGTIQEVILLANREDHAYAGKVVRSGLLEEWCGFPVSEAPQLPVDAVTGATRTSSAIIASVRQLLAEQ